MAAKRGAPTGHPAATSAMNTTTTAATAATERSGASHAATGIAAKAQEFAHHIVEFADFDACCKFFTEKAVDLDKPNDAGWTILMRICACGRADLVGYAADATTNVSCATVPNRTNVLHLAAMSSNPQVIQELVATPERRAKLRAIVDSPNINGDTPLMMACVAKNVETVRVLLADLQANASHGNANGMTALMCAARLSVDAAQDLEEDMAASSAILKLLLARDVHVNASDIASGNTALHFALLSHNVRGVQVLTESAVDVDVLVANLAGVSAFNLGKIFSATPEIMECLERKFKDAELAALERSRALEKELMRSDSSAAAAAGGEAEKKSKKAKSSSKSKKKPFGHRPVDHTEAKVAASTVTAEQESIDISSEEDKERVSVLAAQPPKQSSETATTATSREARDGDAEDQEWQEVATKKNRRKISISEEKNGAGTKEKPRVPRKVPSANKKAVSTKTSSVPSVHLTKATKSSSVSAAPPANNHATAPALAPALAPVTKVSTTSRGPSSTLGHSLPATAHKQQQHLDARTLEAPEFAKQQRRVEAGGLSATSSSRPLPPPTSLNTNTVSYHKLNAIFHRTFPMADELDIPVESFVIASSSTDIELQPSDDGLSISQLEVLQEAHLKAYHYLNEKKMELTRVLEAQRLEAQFALQNEILHLN